MSFCSFHFIFFFFLVFVLYYKLPSKYQWVLLLISSYYFYMCWKPEFIILILISTCIDYFSGLSIERTDSKKIKRMWLLLSICSNLSILFFFKYFNFFGDNINAVLRTFSIPFSVPALNIILPVGISFYTFQTMSYTIEVYRGNIKAERHFGYFALFVTYFPQLVAGPIERPQDLIPQLKATHQFSYDNAVYGTKLMAWGFFKKLVVADTAALFVDKVYNNLGNNYNGWSMIIATFLFAMQVYCDFGGYSDIARGCAHVMGVNLMVNFKSPYFFSRSIKDYWSRNHVSLSKWFTSYVYIPLGGSKKGLLRKYLNNMVTFLLSGLWHGADWTFVIWGGLQSVYLNIGDFLRKKLKREHIINLKNARIQTFMSIAVTCCLSCFSLIFFRANNMSDAVLVIKTIIRDIFGFGGYINDIIQNHTMEFDVGKTATVFMGLSLLILFVFDWFNEKYDAIEKTAGLSKVVQWTGYVGFIVYLILAIPNSAGSAFIYFQF